MHKSYRLIVFDWEGTLSDTLGKILHSLANEAKRLQFGEIDKTLAYQSVEFGLTKAIKILFPHLKPDQQDELVQAVQQSLISRSAEVYLIPGAKDFIEYLYNKDVYLAIASNKGQHSLQRLLQVCKLDCFFKVIRCAGQVPPKPCPQMLVEILAEFDVSSEETLMVGDSTTDIEMARSLNVDAVGMDFYRCREKELRAAGALEVFYDYKALESYLQCFKQSVGASK